MFSLFSLLLLVEVLGNVLVLVVNFEEYCIKFCLNIGKLSGVEFKNCNDFKICNVVFEFDVEVFFFGRLVVEGESLCKVIEVIFILRFWYDRL